MKNLAKWIARMEVLNLPQSEMAIELNLTPVEIENLRQSEGYQEYLEECKMNVIESFLAETSGAKETLELSASLASKLCAKAALTGRIGIKDLSPAIQLKAAQDILDRTGHSGKAQQNILVLGDTESFVNIYEKRKKANIPILLEKTSCQKVNE
jgi:hypothetical protein